MTEPGRARRQPVRDGSGALDPRAARLGDRAENPTLAGLFVYQFEALSRNRLGYGKGLEAIADDPSYDEDWRDYIIQLWARLGQ